MNQTKQRFDDSLSESGLFPLTATGITVFQINVGRVCNQTCRHCHVDAGPHRTESMTREIAELCVRTLEQNSIPVVDITGGAPELNPNFRWLVEQSRALDRTVINRSNLTALLIPSQAGLAEFMAAHHVEIVASFPYYLAARTDAQRGAGVFSKSIEALRMLNTLGYGVEGTDLRLNFVYNPAGAFLPPAQHAIEADFRRELRQRFGIVFNSVYTMVNMPIGRFYEFLVRSGNYDRYMDRLARSFNAAAAARVMCRYTLSVGWDGRLFDCDFNQMLDLSVNHGVPAHIRDFAAEELETRRIVTDMHCYGCTAGAGSSCRGASVA